MNEYIEKAAILSKCEEMWNNADETTQTGVDTINAVDRITDLIEAMPAADVQPVKRGRWIEDDNCFHHCSECKENTIRDIDDYGCECGEFLTDYCPNCGADMRGDEMRNLTEEEAEIYDQWLNAEAETKEVDLFNPYKEAISDFNKLEEFCDEEDKRCINIYYLIDKFVGSLRYDIIRPLTNDEYNGIMTAIAKEMGIIDYLG